jgi:hypothetical protein
MDVKRLGVVEYEEALALQQRLLGRSLAMDEVEDAVIAAFGPVFGP